MVHYAPQYDPPLVPDVPAERDASFRSVDQPLFLHVGHFISWYAAAEFGVTILLHSFTGNTHPAPFHILTRGMDAKVKIERLKEAVEAHGWTVDAGLTRRLEHFQKTVAGLRNTIVHSHLYWPAGGDLQMTSIGAPPMYTKEPIIGSPPKTIPGLELFERGLWLRAMAYDLFDIEKQLPQPLPRGGTLGKANYQSSLPTGDRPSPETLARRASAGKRAQKHPPKE